MNNYSKIASIGFVLIVVMVFVPVAADNDQNQSFAPQSPLLGQEKSGLMSIKPGDTACDSAGEWVDYACAGKPFISPWIVSWPNGTRVPGVRLQLFKRDNAAWSILVSSRVTDANGEVNFVVRENVNGTYYYTTYMPAYDTWSNMYETFIVQNCTPVASFKILNPNNGRGQVNRYIENKYMVGGRLQFNASESRVSEPTSSDSLLYKWFFGDSNRFVVTKNPVIYHSYSAAKKYTVNLTVYNKNIQSNTVEKTLDLSMIPGDLIFIRSGGIWGRLFDLIHNKYTHVGMYVGKINGIDYMIETTSGGDPLLRRTGVHYTPIDRWNFTYESYADWMRVRIPSNAPADTRQRAIAFARSKLGHAYDTDSIISNWRQLDRNDPILITEPGMVPMSENYYCSDLVWAAYYRGSNGAIDLAQTDSGGYHARSPDDILYSGWMFSKGSHHERYPT